MTKIVKAEHKGGYCVELTFSDGTWAKFDAGPLVQSDGPLAAVVREEAEFARFYIELGALCWRHGLELSAESLRRKLDEAGQLRGDSLAA